MLETVGIFTIIGLIFWGIYLLARWGNRVEQRSAIKIAKKRTDKYLSSWWLRNSDRSRSSYVWQHAATGFFVVCGVWFILGLFFGPKAFPGGIFLYLPWRRARYTWDANMAECQLRGLAGSVAAVSATSEVPRASIAPTDPVPTIPEQFFVYLRKETKGPYTQAQILSMWDSGVLTADTLYWSEDAQTWLPLRGLIVPDDGKMVSPPPPAQNAGEFSQSHLQLKPVDTSTDSFKWSGGQAAAAVVFLTVLVIIVCFASWRTSGPTQESSAATLPASAPPRGSNEHEERVKKSREFAASLWPELNNPDSAITKEYTRILNTDTYRDDDYPFAFAKRAATALEGQRVNVTSPVSTSALLQTGQPAIDADTTAIKERLWFQIVWRINGGLLVKTAPWKEASEPDRILWPNAGQFSDEIVFVSCEYPSDWTAGRVFWAVVRDNGVMSYKTTAGNTIQVKAFQPQGYMYDESSYQH